MKTNKETGIKARIGKITYRHPGEGRDPFLRCSKLLEHPSLSTNDD
jgi:hypothetical protein